MNVRTVVLATGLCLSLVTAGCASAVAGQAEIASGAVLPTTSQSAPSPFPDPTSSESSDSSDSSSSSESSGTASSDSSSESTDGPTAVTTEDTGTTLTSTDDSSTGPTSIPGLSRDCNAVLAGITAFGNVLQKAGSAGTISQATVDEALKQLPASGLPARPQADVTVLRTTVSGAAGKTLSDLSAAFADGKVVEAVSDLSDWFKNNCS